VPWCCDSSLPAIPIYNTYNFTADTFEALTTQRTSLALDGGPSSPAEIRFVARGNYKRTHGGLPRMSRLRARLQELQTPDESCQIILGTVLDERLEAAPATDWMTLWSILPDFTPHEAAELVVCAMEDCDQPPGPLWLV